MHLVKPDEARMGVLRMKIGWRKNLRKKRALRFFFWIRHADVAESQ